MIKQKDKNLKKEETKRKSGIGLCLSGGGFRASLFHMGALRRLNEVGILQKIETISSVSGGSIFAAFLVQRMKDLKKTSLDFSDWEKEISQPFREFVSIDIRTIPFILFFGINIFFPSLRISFLKRSYKKRLNRLKLADLPDKPDFIFCATDLTFGVNWEFGKNQIGDYQTGYLKKNKGKEWSVAFAVAASSSFPPIFGPVSVPADQDDFKKGNYKEKDRRKLISKLYLSDGGVYDNLGIQPISNTHQSILVSNCGAPFDFEISKNYFRRLLRYTTVITNQAAGLRKTIFFTGCDEKWHKGAYWSHSQRRLKKNDYSSEKYQGYSLDLVKSVLSNIRTDLDAFTISEMKVLENHGYCAADYGIKKYYPQLIPKGDSSFNIPHIDWMDEELVRKKLKYSHCRFSLKRLLLSIYNLLKSNYRKYKLRFFP